MEQFNNTSEESQYQEMVLKNTTTHQYTAEADLKAENSDLNDSYWLRSAKNKKLPSLQKSATSLLWSDTQQTAYHDYSSNNSYQMYPNCSSHTNYDLNYYPSYSNQEYERRNEGSYSSGTYQTYNSNSEAKGLNSEANQNHNNYQTNNRAVGLPNDLEFGELNVNIMETRNCFSVKHVWQITRAVGIMNITIKMKKLNYPSSLLNIHAHLVRKGPENHIFGINFICKMHEKEWEILNNQYVVHPRHKDIKNSCFQTINGIRNTCFRINNKTSDEDVMQKFGIKFLCNNECKTNSDSDFIQNINSSKQSLVISIVHAESNVAIARRIIDVNVTDSSQNFSLYYNIKKLNKFKKSNSIKNSKNRSISKEKTIDQLLEDTINTAHIIDYPIILLREKLEEKAEELKKIELKKTIKLRKKRNK